MSEKTGQPMFIDTLDEQHPERVLSSIHLDYTGFRVVFDLPAERKLQIEINAFAKENSTIEAYEHLQGRESYHRYWLVESRRYEVSGTDPLPLLTSYLKTAIGGIEHSYEGSFAEVLLAASREKRASSMDTFHVYLQQRGYDVPQDSHVFQALFDLYQSGDWGEMVETEFAPVWAWKAKAEALLAPFKKRGE